MAEANFDEFVVGGALSRKAGLARAVNLAGAACTLALVAGVAVWGYRLAVRDAHGVPVIQAMEGPMRIAPEDPGGRIAPHAGLSVNRIAAEGTAGTVPDRVTLAPPPVELASEDSPGIGTAAPAVETEADVMARTLALAEELARTAASEPAAPEAAPADAPDTALPVGAVQQSPRPMPRPARTAEAAQSEVQGAVAVSAPAASTEEIDGTALPPGTRLAQIGAYDEAEQARADWDRIALRHAALFEGKVRVVQEASSVGRVFYRLRVAGFASEDESRRFCAAIESGDLRCIPVTTR